MKRTEHKSEDILNKLKSGNNPLVIHLNPGDSSWNPATTKSWHSIRGPSMVTYTRFSDGGVKANVEALPIAVELRDAVVAHYMETGERAEPQHLATILGVSESTVRKRMRTLDYNVDGCDLRHGTNGRSKTSYTPNKQYLRKLLLEASGMGSRFYTAAIIQERIKASDSDSTFVVLAEGDYSWNPLRGTDVIVGPARVTYQADKYDRFTIMVERLEVASHV